MKKRPSWNIGDISHCSSFFLFQTESKSKWSTRAKLSTGTRLVHRHTELPVASLRRNDVQQSGQEGFKPSVTSKATQPKEEFSWMLACTCNTCICTCCTCQARLRWTRFNWSLLNWAGFKWTRFEWARFKRTWWTRLTWLSTIRSKGRCKCSSV